MDKCTSAPPIALRGRIERSSAGAVTLASRVVTAPDASTEPSTAGESAHLWSWLLWFMATLRTFPQSGAHATESNPSASRHF